VCVCVCVCVCVGHLNGLAAAQGLEAEARRLPRRGHRQRHPRRLNLKPQYRAPLP
jgi:hypothetical protein